MTGDGKGQGELSQHAQLVASHIAERIARLEEVHTAARDAQLSVLRAGRERAEARLTELEPLVKAFEQRAEKSIARLRRDLEAAQRDRDEARALSERLQVELVEAKREAERVPSLVEQEARLTAQIEEMRNTLTELQLDVKELEEELAKRPEMADNATLPARTLAELDAMLSDLGHRIEQGRAALRAGAEDRPAAGGNGAVDLALLVNTPTSLQTEILMAIARSRRVFVYQVQIEDAPRHDLIAVSPQYVGDSLPSRMRMLRDQAHLMDGKRLREDVLIESLAALGVVSEPARATGRVERVVRTMLLLDRERLEARFRQCELEVPDFRGTLVLSVDPPVTGYAGASAVGDDDVPPL